MLSQMIAKMFADNPLTIFPTVGLALFMGVFVVVSINTMRRRASSYDELARLPLENDEEVRDGR
jgi:hypothetical protein